MKRGPKARVLKATQANFDLLPGLVSRQEFLDWTGLTCAALSRLVEKKQVKVCHEVGVRGLYYKTEIARLTGFVLTGETKLNEKGEIS